MTPALFNPNAEDAFEFFIGTSIGRADDLYYLDGETAFRCRYGQVETFDSELLDMGGQR